MMHISSLPGKYGIGTMGKEAYDFVGWLSDSAQTYWQILPTGPLGFGSSPYSSCSAFAGNPLFIDLEQVAKDGYLTDEEVMAAEWTGDRTNVDYDAVKESRKKLFECMFERFRERIPEDFQAFCEENAMWLDDFAFYKAICDETDDLPLAKWEKGLRSRRPAAMEKWRARCEPRILMYKMQQYFFFTQ